MSKWTTHYLSVSAISNSSLKLVIIDEGGIRNCKFGCTIKVPLPKLFAIANITQYLGSP